MQWKGIPFETMLPSGEIFKTVILPHTGVAMIPVLMVHNDVSDPQESRVIQDTKEIMDFFEGAYASGASPSNFELLPTPMQHPAVPRDPNHAFAAYLFELLADEWLLTQAMYWRWYQPHLAKQRKFLATEFGSSRGGTCPLKDQQNVGEVIMQRFSGFTPGLGVSEETSPALKWQFHELLKLMERHFDNFPFLLGNYISLADFAFWGPFGAHLGRDPVPSFLIKTEAPAVWEWIERLNGGHRWSGRYVKYEQALKATYGTSKPHAPQVEENDIPKTAAEVLKFLLGDYAPVLLATVDRTIQYIEQKSACRTTLPRSLGESEFALSSATNEVKGSRRINTHAVWELDRILVRLLSTEAELDKRITWLKSISREDTAKAVERAVHKWLSTGRHIERQKGRLVAVASPRKDVHRL